jgi:hypothetical protein
MCSETGLPTRKRRERKQNERESAEFFCAFSSNIIAKGRRKGKRELHLV